jgi:hypothetical protein
MLLGLTVVLFGLVLLVAAPSLAAVLFASSHGTGCIGVVAVLVALAGLGLAVGGFDRAD